MEFDDIARAHRQHRLVALQLLNGALWNEDRVAAQLGLNAHLAELPGQQRVLRVGKAGL
jgi:hypothetical protein